MKIAVCFSGCIRTGQYTTENMLRFIGDLYPHCDFFLHTWSENDYKHWHEDAPKTHELCRLHNITDKTLTNRDFVNIIYANKKTSAFPELDKFKEKYSNKLISIEIEDESSYNKNFHFPRQFGMMSPHWYSWYKSILLKRNYEQLHNFVYDYVLKLRTDIVFDEDAALIDEINNIKDNNTVYAQAFESCDAWINDIFLISKSQIMDRASEFIIKTEDRIWYTNMPGEYFKKNNIKFDRTLLSKYAVYRPEAIPISSLNYKKCYNIDYDFYDTKLNSFRYKDE